MSIEREDNQNKLMIAILDRLPRWYDPRVQDPLEKVEKALHDFLNDLYEDKTKRLDFVQENRLGINEMIKLHDMFSLLQETGSTGDTGELLDKLMENSRFK